MHATRTRTTLALLTAITLLTATATACSSSSSGGTSSTSGASAASGDWNSVVAAAKKEGKVTFYAGIPSDLLKNIDDAFTKKYGIKVNLVQLSTIPLIQRLENNIKAHQQDADVVNFGDPATLATFLKQGNIIDESPNVPDSSYWPSKYYSHGVGVIDVAATTIAYNTKLVSAADAPTSWQDLLNPKWKGQIGIFDPTSVNAAEPYEYLYETYGADYLKGLAANSPKDYMSGSDQASALASGEIKVAAVVQLTTVAPLEAQGAPIKTVPNLDSAGWVGSVFAMASAPHTAAAKVLLDFILSKEGQSSFLGNNVGVSALNLPGTIPLPAKFSIPDPSKTQDDLNHLRSLLKLPPLSNS
jgi:iron(III) transport system substrate-binding protein